MEKIKKILKLCGIILWCISFLIFSLMAVHWLKWDKIYCFSFLFILGAVFIGIYYDIERKEKLNKADEKLRLELEKNHEELYMEYGKFRSWWKSFTLILMIIIILIGIIRIKLENLL